MKADDTPEVLIEVSAALPSGDPPPTDLPPAREFYAWPPPARHGGQQVADYRVGVLALDPGTGIAVVSDGPGSRMKNRIAAETELHRVLDLVRKHGRHSPAGRST